MEVAQAVSKVSQGNMQNIHRVTMGILPSAISVKQKKAADMAKTVLSICTGKSTAKQEIEEGW